MTQAPYPYKRLESKRYIFISVGKKRIAKVVDFVSLGMGNIFNLGFGDLLPDGSMPSFMIPDLVLSFIVIFLSFGH